MVKSTMKGRLVGKFGAQDRAASAHCDVEVVEGLDNGRSGLPGDGDLVRPGGH